MENKTNSNSIEVVKTLVDAMGEFLSSKTVVGEPIVIDENTKIVPFVDVSFGAGAGNSVSNNSDNAGGGIGVKATPNSVLIISNGTTRIVNVKHQDTVSKIVDMIPDLVNKVAASKTIKISDEEAEEKAFDTEE